MPLLVDFLAMKKLGVATDVQVQKLTALQNDLKRLKGESFLDDLQRELDTMGMDSIELKIFDLQNMKLGADQLKQAQEILQQMRSQTWLESPCCPTRSDAAAPHHI